MEGIAIVFTAKEILEQIHRELIKVGANLKTVSVEQWKQYILARAIEEVFLIDLTPAINPAMESISSIIQSNYRRQDGEQYVTIHQDVGNKLFPYLRSSDLSFESNVELHRHRVTVSPRGNSR